MEGETVKKKLKGSPVNRVTAHEIDTRAARELQYQLPSTWLVRYPQDRDYGIDLMVEVFDDQDATGSLILLQVKGREKAFSAQVKLGDVPVKTLLYAQMFAAPFFLLYVSLTDKTVYYVWLQKYIKIRLPLDSPNWRKQDTVTVYFPEQNVLSIGVERIEKLAGYIAHRDMGLTFLASYEWFIRHMRDIQSGNDLALDAALMHLREISNLIAFLATYEEWTEKLDVGLLLRILQKAKQYKYADLDDEEHDSIDVQLEQLGLVKMQFLARDEMDAFALEISDDSHPY